MVFYRKYRPQKIEELDNEAVREGLYSIFSKGSFVHAFLFTGPKGLGKTSAARIVAKVINCEKHKDLKGLRSEKEIEPDNKCGQCLSITNGNNLDVLEIDGASNRGIDEIRDLKEKINLAPFKASKKIYIIDEVHMLTTEAFNALLKTLEEPPSHAVFILCTTELQKVPATILSRCFRVNFTKATNEELLRSMQRIVKAEDIKIENQALIEIAKVADGSFRDGAKILEEIAIFAGKKLITKNLVNEKYNTLGIGESVMEMIKVFEEKDLEKGFKIAKELEKQGMDFKFFIEQLIERLHLMLLNKVGVGSLEGNSTLSLEDLKKLFELLSDAYSDTKFAVLAQVPLELAILEWAGVRNEDENLRGPVSLTSSNELRAVGSPFTRATPLSSRAHGDFFEKFIEEVKSNNHLIAGLLRSCKAEEILNGKLTIVASSKFHKERLEEQKTIELLKDCVDKISGKKIKIEIILKEVKS